MIRPHQSSAARPYRECSASDIFCGFFCNIISQIEAANRQEVKFLNEMGGICDMDGAAIVRRCYDAPRHHFGLIIFYLYQRLILQMKGAEG
jgi:hypothetical protein